MISVDTPEDNKGFAEKEKADFPILSDPGKQVAEAYGVLRAPSAAQPTAPRFAQRWTFYIGPDGKILHIDNAVKPASSGPDMVARLGELKIAKRK